MEPPATVGFHCRVTHGSHRETTYFREAKVLVPADSRAEGSGTPTSKSIEIQITPHSG
jgi:hypothetical protein